MDLCVTDLCDMIEAQYFFDLDPYCFIIRKVLSGTNYLHDCQRELKLRATHFLRYACIHSTGNHFQKFILHHMYKGHRLFQILSQDDNSEMVYSWIKNAHCSVAFYDDKFSKQFLSRTMEPNPSTIDEFTNGFVLERLV